MPGSLHGVGSTWANDGCLAPPRIPGVDSKSNPNPRKAAALDMKPMPKEPSTPGKMRCLQRVCDHECFFVHLPVVESIVGNPPNKQSWNSQWKLKPAVHMVVVFWLTELPSSGSEGDSWCVFYLKAAISAWFTSKPQGTRVCFSLGGGLPILTIPRCRSNRPKTMGVFWVPSVNVGCVW